MASFTRSFFFFFFFTITLSTLLLSTQIHARESYFFHKFQRDNAQDKNPSSVPVEAIPKTSGEVLPKNEQEQQDQENPSFVPESENGYGLYGHETTYNNENNNNNNNNEGSNKKYEENVNYEPFNTPSLSQTEESYNYDKYSKDNENYNYNNNNYNFNNNGKNKNNDNENNYYYNSNAYGRERSSSSMYDGYNNNGERQGMSDTRFVENGKYYFDINDEENHGELYKKHYRNTPSYYAASNYGDRFGQDNNGGSFYDNVNSNEQNRFQDPYNSKWEKNMMNEQEQEQDQFVP